MVCVVWQITERHLEVQFPCAPDIRYHSLSNFFHQALPFNFQHFSLYLEIPCSAALCSLQTLFLSHFTVPCLHLPLHPPRQVTGFLCCFFFQFTLPFFQLPSALPALPLDPLSSYLSITGCFPPPPLCFALTL